MGTLVVKGLISNNSNILREFLSNNATQFFRVHINQLLKLPNNTDFLKDYQTIVETFFNAETFRELLPNNTTHIFRVYIDQSLKCQIILTFPDNYYQSRVIF